MRPYRRCLAALLLLGLLAPLAPARAQERTPNPTTVTIPGTIQSALGCPADWQPTCANTYLAYDPAADLWSAAFDLPAGDYEYKVALNDSWGENYGLKAQRGGANIPLTLSVPARVRFIYDHKTTFVTDSVSAPIAVLVGDFQSELGCPADSDPACLASWLQDPDGDGVASLTTTKLLAGDYTAQVALGESLDGAIGDPISFTVKQDGDEIYVAYSQKDDTVSISTEGAPRGDISIARAYWVRADTLAWNVLGTPKFSYELFSAPEGGLELTPQGIEGGQSIALSFSSAGPGDALKQFPQLAGFSAFTISPADLASVPELLRGQLAITARDEEGKLVDATGLQIPGALDDLFSYDGPLGVSWESDPNVSTFASNPTFRLWAPTARSVSLLVFDEAESAAPSAERPLIFDPASGVWQIGGEPNWKGKYYLYEVEVYAPASGKVETNLVTDPYALSLSANSTRSQVVDLRDAALAPAGWEELEKPALAAPNEIVLYELHVRDFSISDASVPAELRGTFAAFAQPDSDGTRHLRELAQAGVTHVHLLPVFDIATIEEDRTQQTPLPLEQLAALPPDSPEQQALLAPLRDKDGFNWGYDPLHYSAPEGSYSTDPNGPQRIVEFRQMVQALNRDGLRVVMDVVYNHTNASGQAAKSVLDRIVPGYYHRLDDKGAVTNSTCCSNTATEHAMMEKLMIDSVLLWARQYKVDGFRFDLMGHHMKRNMLKLRAALDELTLERDGVDGRAIYLYGEGWDFGEVAANGRGENATQINMAGTGIGTFSDRLRDAVRGGGPFDDPRLQGFATGLFDEPNGYEQGDAEAQRGQLLEYSDWIRLGLAGNLKSYELTDREGRELRGEFVQYNGAPAGYTLAPHEQIVYVSAHDNETLFDIVQLKAPPSADLGQRVRMHNLALSLAALSQGIPFFHAGDELLRSKSLDRNSYNSSDWFNRIDWTGQTSNFGVGLPPAGDNEEQWPIMAPLLADPALRPGPQQIAAAYAHFKELLAIRKSSPLFRLRSAEEIQAELRFANTGPGQLPGLIVMSLHDADGELGLDPQWGQIIVLFNANKAAVEYTVDDLIGLPLELHPIQRESADPLVREARFDQASGSFSLPGRTSAVFVSAKALPQAAQPSATAAPTSAPTAAPAPTATPALAATPAPTAAPTAVPTATPATAAPTGAGWAWPALAAGIVTLLAGIGLLVSRRRGKE